MGGLLFFPAVFTLVWLYSLCLRAARPDALVLLIDEGPEARARQALNSKV